VDRDENIRRIGFVAQLLAKHGVTTIVAAVSPYRHARDQVRALVRCFIEVHLRCPLEVLERRDPKRL
jgi:adenylylsulfate kinase